MRRQICDMERHDLVLVVNAMGTPHDEEWDAFLDLMSDAAKDHGRCNALVLAFDRSAPSSAQRYRMSRRKGELGATSRYAIMTSSSFVRVTVNLICAFRGDMIKAFREDDIQRAMNWLGYDVTDQRIRRIAAKLDDMTDEIVGGAKRMFA